ncbi:MAG: rhodanese-related sulfurtransferase, partial [Burkholderiales bacterium]|nr:rhodanese-related sulfurtransferase [Burkholderiales bacterium]
DLTPALLGYRQAETVSAAKLNDELQLGNSTVLDFASSLEYRAQHIPGALWALRSRLGAALAAVTPDKTLVITSPDGLLAHYVAHDLAQEKPTRQVIVLDGGTRAWIDAGLPASSGAENLTTEANDVWYKPYEQVSAVREAMQGYLDWEVNLVNQIERDGDAQFR